MKTSKMRDDRAVQGAATNQDFQKMKAIYKGKPIRNKQEFLEADAFHI